MNQSYTAQWLGIVVMVFGFSAVLGGLDELAKPFAWIGVLALAALLSLYVEDAIKKYRAED